MSIAIFRGKSSKSGKWIQGSLIELDDNFVFICPRYEETSTLSPLDLVKTLMEPVDPETICQWTGMTDKNGKMIFEDDKIIYYQHKKNLIPTDDASIVEQIMYGIDKESGLGKAYRETRIIRRKGEVYIDVTGSVRLSLNGRYHWWNSVDDDGHTDDIEVIGNIHDNPELLKEGK